MGLLMGWMDSSFTLSKTVWHRFRSFKTFS